MLGEEIYQFQKLVDASKEILQKAICNIKGGVRISEVGYIMEIEAKKRGFKVIKILVDTVSEEVCTNNLTK